MPIPHSTVKCVMFWEVTIRIHSNNRTSRGRLYYLFFINSCSAGDNANQKRNRLHKHSHCDKPCKERKPTAIGRRISYENLSTHVMYRPGLERKRFGDRSARLRLDLYDEMTDNRDVNVGDYPARRFRKSDSN